jgi:two-component system, LytTR family, sensor kinase
MFFQTNKNRFKRFFNNSAAYHFYIWIVLFLLLSVENLFDPSRLVFALTYVVLAIMPVYSHFFILDKFLIVKRFLIYLISLFIIIIAFGWIEFVVIRSFGQSKATLFGSMIAVLFLIVLSTAIKFGVRGIRKELTLRELKSKHVQTELALLKSQINPHFLFNTLNNLFALARKQKDNRTANGISKLANMMRYMIHETNVEKIELKKEVEQIESFIELQKLRFSKEDDVRINFNVVGKIDQISIAPMLLIPFVENAFKHSVSVQQPTEIEIDLTILNDEICFAVKNSINKNKQDLEGKSNIGLNNVKRRLELIYPQVHNLELSDTGDYFSVELKIKLKK